MSHLDAVLWPWLVFALVWLLLSFRVKPTERSESAGSRSKHLIPLFIAMALLFQPRAGIGPLGWRIVPDAPGARIIGLVLTSGGMFFTVWARLQLGSNWSGVVTIKQQHTLVVRGPYRLVRHPIYSGLLLAILGTAITYGRIRCFLGLGLAFASWLAKSRIEERFLIRQFGSAYEDYCRQVKALIPFVL